MGIVQLVICMTTRLWMTVTSPLVGIGLLGIGILMK